MNKYWYVVQNEADKSKKEFLIGYCYGNPEQEESALLEGMQDYCEERCYRLALLIQSVPMLPIVNQVYPAAITEESRECMEYVLGAIYQ